MAFLTSTVVVQEHFTKRRTLAYGISASGNCVGILICGPLLRILIDTYGLRGSFLLLAAFTSHNIVCGFLYRPAISQTRITQNKLTPPNGEAETPGPKKKYRICDFFKDAFDFSILSNPKMSLMYLGTLLSQFGIMTFSSHMVSRAIFEGIHPKLAALLLTILGACAFLGRIISGLIANHFSHKVLQYTVWIWICAAVEMVYVTTKSFISNALVTALFGLLSGKHYVTLFSLAFLIPRATFNRYNVKFNLLLLQFFVIFQI